MARITLCAIAGALVASAVAQPVYWWRYPNTDAEKMDIKQMPCGQSCTLAELEAGCLSTPGCVAFNTHGWLKNSLSDMAPDSCDLYVKKTTPQPSPTPTPPPPAIAFWPLPTTLSMAPGNRTVSPSLTFSVTGAPNADLSAYAARIAGLVFQNAGNGAVPANALTSVQISVANPTAPLALGVDESYTLTMPPTGNAFTLAANTTFGAYMGLQTLSQAIRFNFDTGFYSVNASQLYIKDAPAFAWRGYLIDTDRHWLSLPQIKKSIDGLTYAKMNVLHWHIVDWQSWPLQSQSYPALWAAAWSPRERYTLADIAAIVEYGRQRGVRVVPEFDTPGHATSMCASYPNLCVQDVSGCGAGGNSPLTPVPDGTGAPVALNAIQAVLSEIAAVTTDEFFHLGGDEVDQSCWEKSASVASWMAKQGFSSTDQVYEDFVAKVDSMALGLDRSPIRWEEVWKHFGTDLDKRTVIHAWLSSDALINATSNGYRAIWSVDGLYYLDDLSEPWQSFYNVDILAGITNASAIPLVLGGETQMWGETVDGSDQDSTIWPRAAAAAERQWSYNAAGGSASSPNVAYRLSAFRCLLLERGIGAAPVNNAQARQSPPGPGSCMTQ